MSAQPVVTFGQATEWKGPALLNNSDARVKASIEYDTDDGITHIVEVTVAPHGRESLPWAREYRLVNKTTRRTVLSFVPWAFALVSHSDVNKFVVKYVQGPATKNVKVEFVRARRSGVRLDYGDSIDVVGPDEWIPGRSYTLEPAIDAQCPGGKFVFSTEDGLYNSMIPWVATKLSNPAYTVPQLVAPVLAQSLLAVLAQAAKKEMMPSKESTQSESAQSAIINTLVTSLIGMHGPLVMSEMGRGVSQGAAQLLPRPGESPAEGWRRVAKNPLVWKRVLSSVIGTMAMGGKK